ncbi:MAG: TlpA disulfide reductase family protein [Flavobacterium sp.]|nr:TlpA disulfide reductase family protein [Flavobacterium sp.]
MNKTCQFLLYMLLLVFELQAQTKNHFVLDGTINTDSGKIILIPVGNASYYENPKVFQEANVVKGKFIFKGDIKYPTAFIIGLKINSEWKYISRFFIVDPVMQNIECNIDSLGETPKLLNNSMKELADYRNNRLLKNAKANLYLYDYIKLKPNSYIALWNLVYEFDYMYAPILDSINASLSNNLKENFTAKVLESKLKVAKHTSIGGSFPNLFLANSKGRYFSIISTNRPKKYLFIDFWFSHCTPCISQFEKLKDLFNKTNSEHLMMIGISVDTKANKDAWLKAINKYQLPWQQYWDIDGKEAYKLNINSYPTNFLLDSNGTIIAKNITPMQLEEFLMPK